MVGGALLLALAFVAQCRAATTHDYSTTTFINTPGVGYLSASPQIVPNSVQYGDTCTDRLECPKWVGFECSQNTARGVNTCQCAADMPATNQLDKCGPIAQLKEKCDFNEQCVTEKSHCMNSFCECMYDMLPHDVDGKLICKAFNIQPNEGFQGNLAMIGVLIGMGLMFIIICIVLRLFSQARWRENRTIFNTPNPRLMNVSLLRENKGGERRGSKGSNHPPVSRQPSLASLRPQSPAQHSQAQA